VISDTISPGTLTRHNTASSRRVTGANALICCDLSVAPIVAARMRTLAALAI
jgi:hypothetical protein